LRAKAAHDRVDLDDLLRIFLRMAKRRGYAGGFREAKDDAELGVVQTGSGELQKQLDALAQSRGVESLSLGDFLADRASRGLPTRLKVDRDELPNLYALRSMLVEEFDRIWDTQEKFHDALRSRHKGRPVREYFREALFHQRPLKSPAAAVGLCPLEKFLPRSPRAQMAAQEFRIEKTLGDLRWGAGRRSEPLSAKQREVIRQTLNSPGALRKDGTVTFKSLYKALDAAACPGPPARALNIDRASREEVRGNTTLKAFEELGLLEAWLALDNKTQTAIINFLADLGSPDQLDADDWDKRFLKAGARPGDKNRFRSFSPTFVDFVNRLRAKEGFNRLTRMGFEGGRMAYSVKALQRLTTWLRDPWWQQTPPMGDRVDEESAVRECYPEFGSAHKSGGDLTLPPKTGNDTVDVALSQVHWVIKDALVAMGGPPSEIIVEFGREVGLSPKRRNEWENVSAKNQRLRNQARKEIIESGSAGTNTEIRRYLLWQEQGTHCPYCGKVLSLTEVLDGSQSHVEHIIPRSLTQVGRKRSEIVIAHASCNHQKGDRTPYQAFGQDEARWTLIEERAKELAKKKQYRKARLLLLKDFEQEVLNDKSIADFVDRQLHQTSWVARAASQWLRSLCPDVFAARGEFTALLRRSWHLDTVIPEIRIGQNLAVLDTDGNAVSAQEFEQYRRHWEGHGRAPSRILEKRLDHRHHTIDALVIGLASRSLYQRLAKNYKASLESVQSGRSRRHEWQVEPPIPDVRAVASEMVRNCRLTHKPDRFPAGAMFQDTAYAIHIDREKDVAELTVRSPLSGLLVEKSVEATRAQIAQIASPEVRDLVMTEFDKRIAAGESPKQALARPVAYPRYGTLIHRVRVIRPDVGPDKAHEVTFRSRNGLHSKHLLPDGNAYLEVKGTGRSVNCRVVPIVEAARGATCPPAAGVRRFYKSDTVIDNKDGSRLVVKQIKATDGGRLILTPVFETRPVRDLRARDGLKDISGSGLGRLVVADVVPPGAVAGGPALPRN
jgi:CRISPR-associated endonuclease Csn1